MLMVMLKVRMKMKVMRMVMVITCDSLTGETSWPPPPFLSCGPISALEALLPIRGPPTSGATLK